MPSSKLAVGGWPLAVPVKAMAKGADAPSMIKGLRQSRQPPIRISDVDRELAAQRLREAHVEGRITIEELESRVAAVHAAVYAADLRQPLAELPEEAILALPARGKCSAEPTVLRAGSAGLKRTGEWLVPARMQVKSSMGSVILDFCDAEIRHAVVQIELKLGAGSAKLLLPDQATADVDGVVATMGAVKSNVASKPKAGAPHFVVLGHTRMGSISVRRRREIPVCGSEHTRSQIAALTLRLDLPMVGPSASPQASAPGQMRERVRCGRKGPR